MELFVVLLDDTHHLQKQICYAIDDTLCFHYKKTSKSTS